KKGYRSLSEPINAYYDTPWTPPFLRRNELMIQVDTDHP
ncbi:MAG: heme-binding protein, partial [Verrucomicrobia bacterium]|nr:heme-binding protein [Verrucomicrobiota bacterium]